MCEIIERVNILAGPKPKTFLFQPKIVVDPARNQKFFRVRKVSLRKATSINISGILSALNTSNT